MRDGSLDTGGLSEPSPTVVQALQSVQAGLRIVRSRYQLDQETGRPKNDPKGFPIEKPRYWVFHEHRGKVSPLFPVETPDGEWMPCDMRLVRRIATDLGMVTKDFEAQWAALEAEEAKAEEGRQSSERERMRRFIENNGPAWREAIANMREGDTAAKKRMRDPVIYSYDGQPIRSSGHRSIPVTSRERGIDTGE